MPSYYWIKLYHEILDDPKMGRLPDKLWRRTIELFLIAGDIHLGGDLPAVGDMAWRLRLTEDELALDLEQLERAGIISKATDTYTVTNFSKRQDKVSNADRQSRYRGRKRTELLSGDDNETIKSQDSNDVVTTRNADTDTDTDTDTDKKHKEHGAKTAPTIPATFEGWREGYRLAENKAGYAGGMLQTLYPNYYKGGKPNYGMLGKLLKSSDAEYVLSLAFQHSARPPVGDPIKFLTGILKKNPAPLLPKKTREKRTIQPITPDFLGDEKLAKVEDVR